MSTKRNEWASIRCGTWGSLICVGIWVLGRLGNCTAAEQPAPIPETQITALEEELAQGMRGTSVVDIRRACKSVTRKAAALFAASPEAPNRYAALAILFKGQKRLLGLENSKENITAIFETGSDPEVIEWLWLEQNRLI